MSGRLVSSLLSVLPYSERLNLAAWRFRKERETFYLESMKEVETSKNVRNRETLSERLEILETRAKSRNRIVHLVYAEIRARLARGDSLAFAMKQFIPREEFALLELAEASTSDDAVKRGFELCAMSAGAQRVLSTTTAVQLAYPVMLLAYMYGLACMFGAMIYPQVLEIRPLDQWPTAGQWLHAFDTYCANYWWFNTAVVVMLVLSYFYGLKRWTGNLRNRCDNMPFLWRNRRDLRGALLVVSMAGLFESGMTLTAALEKIKLNADPWLRWHVSRMLKRLKQRPDEPMYALDTGIFSTLIVDKIADAARRDDFVQAVKTLGRGSLDSVVEAVKRNARITHMVMLGFAALAFVVVGLGSYLMTGLVGLQSMMNSGMGGF